jgi:hypothetical protein
MPPQPLSRVRPSAKVFASPESIQRRPRLAPFIAEVIARWADIEANVGSILAFLLAAEAGPTIAMLQAVRSASAQMDMIEAAGKIKLTDPELEMFEAVVRLARSAARKRNNVAHHIWAYCNEIPEGLLLIEPAAYLDIFVAVSKANRNPEVAQLNESRVEPDSSRILVYREPDFTEIIDELKSMARCTTFLINYLHLENPSRNRMYSLLWNEPLIPSAVKAVRKNRPSIPEPE